MQNPLAGIDAAKAAGIIAVGALLALVAMNKSFASVRIG